MEITPTLKKERIHSLDVLRGFAVLGILIMNIQSFAMPEAAYLNPMAYGSMEGGNQCVWMLSHIFADQKFMTIFSILFGAGVILFTDNVTKRSGKSAALHYRRTFWLLVIGLVHAHIIWHGDILVAYAICALFVYLFRNRKPKTLLILGIVIISIHTFLYLFIGNSFEFWSEADLAETSNAWQPSSEAIQEEINAFTGSWGEQFTKRSAIASFMETGVLFMIFLWRASGLMLVGMALYKWGVLSAERSTKFYRNSFLISWAIGLPIVIYGVVLNYQHSWSMEFSMFLGSQYNYWGSLLVSFGFISLIMLLVKSHKMQALKSRLAAVGQMALTNYLMQSIICSLIFYGIGFGLIGQVERVWQIVIVLGIWLVELIWSKPWLNNYQFGPFEWLWRSLTYFKLQPLKKNRGD